MINSPRYIVLLYQYSKNHLLNVCFHIWHNYCNHCRNCFYWLLDLKICWIIMIDTFKITHFCLPNTAEQLLNIHFPLQLPPLSLCEIWLYYMPPLIAQHGFPLLSSKRFTFGTKCFSDCSVGFHYKSVVNQSKSGLATMIHCMLFEVSYLYRTNIRIITRVPDFLEQPVL